jgi:hypothetical protein
MIWLYWERANFNPCLERLLELEDRMRREQDERDAGYETAGEDDTIGGLAGVDGDDIV